MKIALVNVGSHRKDTVNKDVMAGFGEGSNFGNSIRARVLSYMKRHGVILPNLSFGYIAAISANNGFEVEVVDNRIPEADIAVIHSSLIENKQEIAMADAMRERGIRVGIIGPLATYVPELYEEHVDFIVSGEAEGAFLSQDTALTGIIKTEPQRDLDALPFPRWDFFNMESFSYFPSIIAKPFVPALSSRGCAFTCGYCPYGSYQSPWRQRSANNVLDELEYLTQEFGVKGLLFRDPLFTFDRERTEEIANGILERGIDLSFAIETRADYLDEKLLTLLKRAGLKSINIGVESYDREILTNLKRRPPTFDQLEKILDLCESKKIKAAGFFVLGLPGDTAETIKATAAYARKLPLFVSQFFISTPLPGTPLFAELSKQNMDTDWTNFDTYTPVFDHDTLSREELAHLREMAFVNYYYSPRVMWRIAKRLFWT